MTDFFKFLGIYATIIGSVMLISIIIVALTVPESVCIRKTLMTNDKFFCSEKMERDCSFNLWSEDCSDWKGIVIKAVPKVEQ